MQIEQSDTDSKGLGFQFDPIQPSFPQDKKFVEYLQKWGIEKSFQIVSFRFDLKFDDFMADKFLLDFFNHPSVRQTVPYIAFKKEVFNQIRFTKLSCNSIKMDQFDKLMENGCNICFLCDFEGIVVKDCIKKTFEDRYEEIEISDLLRETILKQESPHYSIFNEGDRNQLLFQLFSILVLGGQLCQYEDNLAPYLDQTKILYKSLVTQKLETSIIQRARKDPVNEQVFVDSYSYQIIQLENVILVIVNPSLKQVNVVANEWQKVW